MVRVPVKGPSPRVFRGLGLKGFKVQVLGQGLRLL